MNASEAFKNYAAFLTSLTKEDVGKLREFVSGQVHFKDPFHDVIGAEAMSEIFNRLFAKVENIKFTVSQHATENDYVYFNWKLEGELSTKPWVVVGVTRLTFDEAGKVVEHIEFWDAATQFYERLPVIGSILRYLRQRIAGS